MQGSGLALKELMCDYESCLTCRVGNMTVHATLAVLLGNAAATVCMWLCLLHYLHGCAAPVVPCWVQSQPGSPLPVTTSGLLQPMGCMVLQHRILNFSSIIGVCIQMSS
jgi:hypothetical protein